MRRALLFLLLCTSCASAPLAVMKLEPYRRGFGVHANAGGRDGFFVFDTGAGVSLITPQFAQQIGCKPWGRITGFAMHGEKFETPHCDDVPVSIEGHKFVAPVATVFDVMTFYPQGAQPMDGLLSLNIFDGKVITIDFPAKTLTLESAASLRRRVAHATPVPMSVAREVQGRAVAVNLGIPTSQGVVWFEIDSGNGGTILINKAYAALFGLDVSKSGPQPGSFTVAGDFRAVSNDVFASDIIIDGNIGMPFLKDVAVTIDLASNRLWLSHSSQKP